MWYDVRCIGARDCIEACPEDALTLTPDGMKIDRVKCTVCGLCETACPAAALEVIGKTYTPEQLFDEVKKDEAFYRNSGGGVTLGGGDSAMQPEAASELLRLCKEAGISTAIDTCGAFAPKAYERMLPYTDLILFDLKIMDDARHREAAGMGTKNILTNAEAFGKGPIPIWVRTPVIPGYTDDEENIRAISRFIRQRMPAVVRYELLAFNNLCGSKYTRLDKTFPLEKTPLVPKEQMERLATIARKEGVPDVQWSGATRIEQ
jgi:pyruvate formate lyase activating enzyme